MSENIENKVETLTNVRERFMRHLSSTGEIKKLSADFAALNTNIARVNFVLTLLATYDIKLPFTNDVKCDKSALVHRNHGNEAFKSKKLQQAWEFYTKSVSKSQQNGEHQSIAYANRSAVLYELKQYTECLNDIDRAFPNYPASLRPKLQKRAESARKCSPGPLRLHEPLPMIIDDHPSIPCASDCLRVDTSASHGRHVVAVRDIHPGEILAIEKPLTLVPLRLLDHCHECLTFTFAPIPCPSCTVALYCSEECRSDAEPAHSHLCPIAKSINELELEQLKRLALKIGVLTLVNRGQVDGIDELCTNSDKRSVADVFERATNAALIFQLVATHTRLFSHFEDGGDVFKNAVLMGLQSGPSNFHEITELAETNGVLAPEQVGSGAYAFHSLLNHACCPNVARFCYGSAVVLRAIEGIPAGEQCYDNYGYHYALVGLEERQRRLKQQYYFDCACAACANNWPLYDNLLSIQGPAKVDDNLIGKLSKNDGGRSIKMALDLLDDLIEELNACQRNGGKPSKNFSELQECVKQCFALFGSKRPLFL